LSNGSAKGHLAVAGILTTFFECSIQYFFISKEMQDLRVLLAALAPIAASCIGFFLYSLYASSSLPDETKLKLKSLGKGEMKLIKDLQCDHLRAKDKDTMQNELTRVRIAQIKLLSGEIT
jgi:hypothetical protein